MKLKKALICALSIGILAACGNQEAEENPAEEPKAVEETVTDENADQSADDKHLENTNETMNEVASEESDPNYVPEYKQIIKPVEEIVQAEAGTNEQSNYFNINGLIGDYVQTGDAFITTHKYQPETKILIIPIKAKNKYKENVNISALTHTELKLIQEDDNSIYQCSYAVTPPDEYQNDITTKTKMGGEGDYYLAYKVEKEGLDFKLVSGLGDDIVFANIKNQ